MTRKLALIVFGLVVAPHRANAAPAIAIDPGSLGFGGMGFLHNGGMPGEQQLSFFWVMNTGTTPLSVTEMTITGPGATVMAFDDPLCSQPNDCASPYTVAPGTQRGFSLTCVTPQPGTFTATLTITSDASSGTNTAPISCLGLNAPQLQVSPAGGLDFGTQHGCWYGDVCGPRCATRPATQTLTITNAAPSPSEVDISAGLPTAGDYYDFTIDSPYQSPFLLDGGQSVDITMTFHPTSPGGQPDYGPLTLTPTYPAGLAPIVVPFHAHTGWGRLVIDTPSLLGSVAVGQTLTTSVTAHDAGDSCLDLATVWAQQDITLLDQTGGLVLQSGESHTWAVSCTSPGVNGGSGWVNFDQYYDDPDTVFDEFYCQAVGAGLWSYPPDVSFDSYDVGVGMSWTLQVDVFNPGDQPTELLAMTSSDPHVTVALAAGSLPITVAPGDHIPVDVTFAPTDTTRVDATILLDASTGSDYTLPVSGTGINFSVNVAPASHDYGAVAYPATPSQDFALHNTGERRQTVNAVSIDLPSDYTITGLAAGATIDPGATLAFSVRANASMLGRRHATLSIDLERSTALAIPLDAIENDPALVVTPASYQLELGSVDVDVGPKIGHVTLHNAGTTAMTLATCALSGDPAFTLATSCPVAIAAGADADLAIGFAPAAEADAVATLNITGTSFATGALRIGLHGTGLDQHVALSATSVDFPATFRHPSVAAIQVVTLRNTATTALALSTITVDGGGFALVSPAAETLAPNESVAITISFAPVSIGDFTGHLVIGNTDDPDIARVGLTGKGIARDLTIAPLAIDLGTVTAGTTVRLGELQPDAITIRNASAAATFTITRAALTGDPAFELIGPDRTVLAPGDAAKLDLTFAPTAAGPQTAQIAVFADGDPDPIAQIAVTGNAVAPSTGGGGGCCSGTGSAGSLPLALGVVLLVLRRRRTDM